MTESPHTSLPTPPSLPLHLQLPASAPGGKSDFLALIFSKTFGLRVGFHLGYTVPSLARHSQPQTLPAAPGGDTSTTCVLTFRQLAVADRSKVSVK